MRVVLIEDDPTISVPLADGLMRSGFDVVAVSTAADGLAAVDGSDLVLLDLGLPDLDGSEVCRRIRQTSSVPIIVISARGDEIDRVLLLESGADDYVVKPFGTRELIARIRAVARRTMPEEAPERQRELGALTIDVAAHRAAMDGVELELTPKEFDLLAYQSSALGVVHRRRDILEPVWDEHWYESSKTLDAHVAPLRPKPADSARFHTVRGAGYRFGVPG